MFNLNNNNSFSNNSFNRNMNNSFNRNMNNGMNNGLNRNMNNGINKMPSANNVGRQNMYSHANSNQQSNYNQPNSRGIFGRRTQQPASNSSLAKEAAKTNMTEEELMKKIQPSNPKDKAKQIMDSQGRNMIHNEFRGIKY